MRIEAGLPAEMRRLARQKKRTPTDSVETVLRQQLAGTVAGSSPTPEAPPARPAEQTKDKPAHAA